MNTRFFVLSVLLSSAATMTVAQEVARRTGTKFAATLRQSISVRQVGDAVHVGGWDYEATIDPKGLRYTPALGMQAEEAQHLALRPLSYGRGGLQHAVLENRVDALASASSCRRGPNTVERFDVTPDGILLSWHFGTPLRGDGDLVVRYDLGSTMPLASQSQKGLAFHLPSVGGVGIGAVTGIDADGRRVDGELRLDDDVLELRLPGAFVDAARYPLVLDPLIGTEFLATTNTIWNDSAADLAYDASNDLYLLVYRRVFAATNMGLRAQRISGSGALIGGYFGLPANTTQLNHPSVASINLRDTFVVAWQDTTSIFGNYDISCCSVAASGGLGSPPTVIAASTYEEIDPDVGGDSTTSGDSALITYTVEGIGVWLARVVVASPGAQPTLVSTGTVSTAASARSAAISKSAGNGIYVVAFFEVSGINGQIRARAFDRTGTLASGTLVVASGSIFTTPPDRCDIDGDGFDFVVGYEVSEFNALNGEHNMWCRTVHWNGNSLTPGSPATPIDTTSGTDQKDPAVAFCRNKFLLLYADQVQLGAIDYDVRGVELALDCSPCGPPIQLTGLNTTGVRNVEFAPAIASKYGGGAYGSDRALLVFTEADDEPPFTSSLVAQRYEAMTGIAPVFLGPSCGNAGTMTTGAQPFAVGNNRFQIMATGVPAGSLPFILLGFPGGETTCGSCIYINSLATVFIPALGGTATYNWNLPCNTAPFIGTNFVAQWVFLLSGTSPCPPLNGVSFSRRVRLSLDY